MPIHFALRLSSIVASSSCRRASVRARSWIFRTVGYGNDALVWKDIVSNLRLVGYDHAISIEHEDSLMSPGEGLRKAIEFLRPIVISQPKGEAYWA